MAMQLGLSLAVIVVLLGVVALSRRRSPPGTRRNALSVTLVLLGFAAAFVVCFGGGFLVHRLRAEAQSHADAGEAGEVAGSLDAVRFLPPLFRAGRLTPAW